MPSSFCEFWWEIEDRYGRYRRHQSGLNYFDIPRSKERAILQWLRENCERLQASELFRSTDSELMRRGPDGPAKFMTADHTASRRLRVVGIRVPHIQDGCLRYAVARREIVADWESSPPRTPVDSVESLRSFVLGSWSRCFDHYTAGGKTIEELLQTMSAILRNFRLTAEWLHRSSGLLKNPIPPIQPHSLAQLQRHVLRILEWLESQCLTPQTHPQEPTEQPIYLDLVVNDERRTVTRRGARFTHLQPITIGGDVGWPLFRALYAKAGAELTEQEINALPGEPGAPKRVAKGRLNAQLRPIEVVIPDGKWQLLDANQRNSEVALAQ